MHADFHCPACGLKGHVSGGADGGLFAATTTIYCLTCGTLQDAVVMEDIRAAAPVPTEPRCVKRKRHPIKLEP